MRAERHGSASRTAAGGPHKKGAYPTGLNYYTAERAPRNPFPDDLMNFSLTS